MNRKLPTCLGIVVIASLALGLVAQSVKTVPAKAFISSKGGPQLITIRSGGEVIAELRILQKSQIEAKGVEVNEVAKNGILNLRTDNGGSVFVGPQGLSPWRIFGEGVEVQIQSPIPKAK